jgi:hypothetical protein
MIFSHIIQLPSYMPTSGVVFVKRLIGYQIHAENGVLISQRCYLPANDDHCRETEWDPSGLALVNVTLEPAPPLSGSTDEAFQIPPAWLNVNFSGSTGSKRPALRLVGGARKDPLDSGSDD